MQEYGQLIDIVKVRDHLFQMRRSPYDRLSEGKEPELSESHGDTFTEFPGIVDCRDLSL